MEQHLQRNYEDDSHDLEKLCFRGIPRKGSALSTRHPMLQHPYKYQGDVIANSTPYVRLPTDAPTRARISFFGSRVMHFVRDPSPHIKTPTWISTRRSTSEGEGGTGNGLLISTSNVSTGKLHSDSSSGAEASGSQKNRMTARKGTLSNQPRLTRVTPTALLGSWVLQLIEVRRSLGLTLRSVPYGKGPLRNLLRRISQEGRSALSNGTKYKEPAGTRSGVKSAWEAVRQLSSDKQQSTSFTRLEIPWRFQCWAVLRWLSGGLCHTRKC